MTWDYFDSQVRGDLCNMSMWRKGTIDMQQLLNDTTTSDNCCTDSRDTLDAVRYASPTDVKFPGTLRELLKMFGDMGIRELTTEASVNEIPTLTAVFNMIPTSLKTEYDENHNTFNMNYISDKEKENNKMNNNNNSMFDAFNGMFGKVDAGMCRLSMNGGIAVKTSNGYKTWNTKSGRLVNCANFVFPAGDEMFFIIPTNKVAVGDIIMVSGRPRYVLKKEKGTITVVNYEDSTVDTILPERHIFMGEAYFYGKIVSMFGDDITGGGKKGMGKIMKYMMLSEMMKGGLGNNQNNAMASMIPYMMMSGGGMGDFFNGIFDFGDDEEDIEAEEDADPDLAALTASLKKGEITGEEFIKKLEELAHDGTDKRAESSN